VQLSKIEGIPQYGQRLSEFSIGRHGCRQEASPIAGGVDGEATRPSSADEVDRLPIAVVLHDRRALVMAEGASQSTGITDLDSKRVIPADMPW
jgi:hypothetical protein